MNYQIHAFHSWRLHEGEIQVQSNYRFFFLAASRLVFAASRKLKKPLGPGQLLECRLIQKPESGCILLLELIFWEFLIFGKRFLRLSTLVFALDEMENSTFSLRRLILSIWWRPDSYTEGKDSNNWRVVMIEMEKKSIGEVNEIYERYCFNKRDKLSTESVNCFVVELKTLAKTCNFYNCLRDSLIRDRIALRIKDEQTTKKFLRIRDLPLNRCIDICGSEEVTALRIKSLSEPVDNINQVKSKKKKPRVPIPDGQSGKKILCKFCGYEHAPERKKCPAWAKCVSGVRKRIILQKVAKMPQLTPLRATKTSKNTDAHASVSF